MTGGRRGDGLPGRVGTRTAGVPLVVVVKSCCDWERQLPENFARCVTVTAGGCSIAILCTYARTMVTSASCHLQD